MLIGNIRLWLVIFESLTLLVVESFFRFIILNDNLLFSVFIKVSFQKKIMYKSNFHSVCEKRLPLLYNEYYILSDVFQFKCKSEIIEILIKQRYILTLLVSELTNSLADVESGP